jgi:hypothetical protein
VLVLHENSGVDSFWPLPLADHWPRTSASAPVPHFHSQISGFFFLRGAITYSSTVLGTRSTSCWGSTVRTRVLYSSTRVRTVEETVIEEYGVRVLEYLQYSISVLDRSHIICNNTVLEYSSTQYEYSTRTQYSSQYSTGVLLVEPCTDHVLEYSSAV